MVSTVGKLKFHVQAWEQFTQDSWILQAISGYKIEFHTQPVQYVIPNEIPFSLDQLQIVNEEVNVLLKKGAIVRSSDEDNQFISNIFIVPKANENYRPVINLKYLMN